jgi:hypothetical protein
LEPGRENFLDAVNLRCDVRRREAGDAANARCILPLEVEQDDLSVDRREASYDSEEAIEVVALLHDPFRLQGIGKIFDLLQADEIFKASLAVADDMGDRNIVRHPIDPRPEGATSVKIREASPDGDVNFLNEVFPSGIIGFVASSEPFDGGG